MGVEITIASRVVTVKGKATGITLKRDFRHLPVSIQKTQNSANGVKKLEVSLYFGLSKQIAALRTVCSHIDNMVTGVQRKFRYAMRLVFAHHPINCKITNGGKTVELRNFMGVKDEIWIEGHDIDDTSRSAALIHQSCLVKNKDIRKFLDGVYVSAHGPVEE